MMEATPSMMKNTIRTRVRDTDPPTGEASRITPATMAMMAETSDHQNPGAPLAQNVVTSPTTPLMRNSQPTRMVTASVASGGMTTANRPSSTRTIPSTRNSTQCSRIVSATAR